jgi:hypothetical protein
MSIRNAAAALCLVATLAGHAAAGTFVQPSASDMAGTSPSGIQWTAIATGTALPVRSSTSGSNGLPGAVVYFNTVTGQLQVDPKNLDLTTLIITYTTGTTNVTGTNPGPFTYASGTTTNAISPTTGTPKTFPAVTAVTGLPPTTFAARVGMTVGSPLGPSLATTGDAGNIASSSGFWNLPWAFPITLVNSGSVGLMTVNNFRTVNQQANANANVLGYGSQQAVFQYSASGIVGNQIGAVIPVVPEPSTYAILAAASLAIGTICRRRQRADADSVG